MTKEILKYDPTSKSGLRWLVTRCGQAKAGSEVGYIREGRSGHKCWNATVNGKMTQVHRLVYELYHGLVLDESMQIDHIDGNALNNDIDNLRAVPMIVNMRNKRMYDNNKSGQVGVYWRHQNESYHSYYACPITKKKMNKYFSCVKMGKDQALEAAIAWRKSKMEELNQSGAGYTERHILAGK